MAKFSSPYSTPAVPPRGLLQAVRDMSDYEKRHYSLARLIRHAIDREEGGRAHLEAVRATPRDALGRVHPLDVVPERNLPPEGLEMELHAALERELGVTAHGGYYLPVRLRALDTKTGVGGQFTVSQNVAPDVIDALVAQSKVLSLGGELVTGLSGGESFPREANVVAATFVPESPGSDVSESDPSFEQIAPQPRMLTATTSYSRKLLASSSVAVELWLRTRLARAHALGIDSASINGSGESGQPIGLLQTAGINIVSLGADGGAPTAAGIHALIRAVGDSNSDAPTNAFLSTAKMREKLSQLARFTGSAFSLWNDDRMVGYNAQVSSNIPQTLVKGAKQRLPRHRLWRLAERADFGVGRD